MAYGTQRKPPVTKFGEWLDLRMRIHGMSGLEIADKLHCSPSCIHHHRCGRQRPSFVDVVAYCWVFGCKDDPETVWKLADIPLDKN